MVTLTIRDLEDDVFEALRERAKARNRSLEEEIHWILKDVAQGGTGLDLRGLAEQITAMTPDVKQTDSVDLLRENRHRE